MNIRKALQEKNKLTGKIQNLFSRMKENNMTEDGQTRPYNSQKVWEEIQAETTKLVDLKVNIQMANSPILSDIYRMAELKTMIRQLRYMECNDGRKIQSGIITYLFATIKAEERDKLVQSLEDEIEKLQEKIDAFNFRTNL
jgi:hypothetical protein